MAELRTVAREVALRTIAAYAEGATFPDGIHVAVVDSVSDVWQPLVQDLLAYVDDHCVDEEGLDLIYRARQALGWASP